MGVRVGDDSRVGEETRLGELPIGKTPRIPFCEGAPPPLFDLSERAAVALPGA